MKRKLAITRKARPSTYVITPQRKRDLAALVYRYYTKQKRFGYKKRFRLSIFLFFLYIGFLTAGGAMQTVSAVAGRLALLLADDAYNRYAYYEQRARNYKHNLAYAEAA